MAKVRGGAGAGVAGRTILRTDAVGASVSAELFRNGMLALGHQPADDPGLHLVPLRVAVRRRRGGDADPGRHQGDRLPGADADSSSTW